MSIDWDDEDWLANVLFEDEDEPYADLEQEVMARSSARARKVNKPAVNPHGWVDGAYVRFTARLQQERDRGERT